MRSPRDSRGPDRCVSYHGASLSLAKKTVNDQRRGERDHCSTDHGRSPSATWERIRCAHDCLAPSALGPRIGGLQSRARYSEGHEANEDTVGLSTAVINCSTSMGTDAASRRTVFEGIHQLRETHLTSWISVCLDVADLSPVASRQARRATPQVGCMVEDTATPEMESETTNDYTTPRSRPRRSVNLGVTCLQA
jgi:hypothetical protein